MEENNKGCIYVLYNPMFDKYGECYKIGQTRDIAKRMVQYTTSYPEKCELKYCSKYLSNYKLAERVVHKILKDERISNNREFFKGKLEDIISLIDEVCNYKKEELYNIIEDNETHINNIEENEEKQPKKEYVCDFCNSTFELKRTLKIHMKTSKRCLYRRPKIDLSCVWCSMSFSIREDLDKHYNRCDGDKLLLYKEALTENKRLNDSIITREKEYQEQLEKKKKELKQLMIERMDSELKLKDNEIKRLDAIVKDLSSKLKITNIIKPSSYNKVLLCSKPLNLDEELIMDNIEKNPPKKGDSIASWFVDNICKNEEGKITIQCTDRKRKTFKYIDEEDNLQTIKGDEIEMLLTGLGLQLNNQFIKNLMELTYKDNIVK